MRVTDAAAVVAVVGRAPSGTHPAIVVVWEECSKAGVTAAVGSRHSLFPLPKRVTTGKYTYFTIVRRP